MPMIARLIGGAGTGKTRSLMDTIEKVVSSGVRDPFSIGFVSFTRAARRVAAERAAPLLGTSPALLEDEGWFRTLHSVCHRTLGVGKELLAADREAAKWIGEQLGEDVAVGGSNEDVAFESSSPQGRVLALWDCCRARMESFADAHDRVLAVDTRVMEYDSARDLIEKYEQAKRLDGRCDFTDLLGRFAGWRFTLDGPEEVAPQGAVPPVAVWFFDEQQDTSPLLDSVCQRLIDVAEWVYCAGDPFQNIYRFAGSDHHIFQAWPANKHRVMPKSWRCPAPILALGEDILRRCSDYWDRGIAPADHDGEVLTREWDLAIADVSPTDDTLILCRTNHIAASAGKMLDAAGTPWLPTRGYNRWNAPSKIVALDCLRALAMRLAVRGSAWIEAVKLLPQKPAGGELLTRGTKTHLADRLQGQQQRLLIGDDLLEFGATPLLLETLESGKWLDLVDGAAQYVAAIDQHGDDVVKNPRVRVGTVHAAKGAEADNVVYVTTTTGIIESSQEADADRFDEERRVEYVACTRARRKLTVAYDPNARFHAEIPV